MKNLPLFLLIIFVGSSLIVSCAKTNLNDSSISRKINLAEKVHPNVPDCGTGHHWDFYLKKCVDDCPVGYHNDSLTGACVVDGGGGGFSTIAVITNPNNPYDHAGFEHNYGVSSIFSSINPSSDNLDSIILVDVEGYLTTLGYDADSMQSFYDEEIQNGYLPFSHLQPLDSLGNTLCSNDLLSSYGNAYVQQINTYCYQFLNTDTITDGRYSFFANNLISLESTIKNDSRITTWEKEVLLSGCSIGRYSAAYWGNYFNGNVGIMSHNGVNPLFLKKLRKWLKVVLKDVGGGVVAIASGTHSFWAILGISVGTSISAAADLVKAN